MRQPLEIWCHVSTNNPDGHLVYMQTKVCPRVVENLTPPDTLELDNLTLISHMLETPITLITFNLIYLHFK